MSKEARLQQKKIQLFQRMKDNEESESKRNDRNQFEKRRRNRFNGLIDELAVLLAERCDSKKKKEKSSILKLSGEYFLEQEKLAAEKVKNELFRNVKPAFVTDDELDFVYLESQNMLIFALDQTGRVVYISDNAHSTLGHLPGHILQRNVFEFIHTQDHFIFQRMLSVLKDDTIIDPSGKNLAQRFQPFCCEFRRGPYSQGNDFETICCFGTILRNLLRDNNENLEDSKCIIMLARPLNSVPVEKILLKADGPQTKFTATLNMEAKYDYLDKRVAGVLGFFSSELIGNSLYEFCHVEDLDNLVEYHKILLLTGRITTCYYRHLTKGQSWIWLRSRYHLSYSDWDSKPVAVTCLSWVVSFVEVCAKQAEILTRDKESFTQIRNGSNKGIDGKSDSSNSSRSNLPAEIGEKIQSRRTTFESTIRSLTPDSSMDRTPGSVETQSSSTSMIPHTTDLVDSQPIDFQESFQFLKSLNLPVGLTGAQQSLHQFLQEKYVQVINAIHKQTEELNVIQKQIKIQGEIRDLIERLEKERSSNDIENECNTTREMLKKFEEMRRVCSGSQALKPTTESAAICSKRLQEIGVQSPSSAVISEENQQITNEVDEQSYSPMKVEQPNSTQTQPDIFFNQEHWLQTQAQQAQLEQQALLVQQTLNSQYFPQQHLMLYHDQQQQMLTQQLELSNGENRALVSQPINPMNTAPPQEILTTANVSPYSASESLYEYQWF
ncbi:circadian locomoter output cycles protein kaput-like [Oculina patagonica]